jgi:hypothetical protein
MTSSKSDSKKITIDLSSDAAHNFSTNGIVRLSHKYRKMHIHEKAAMPLVEKKIVDGVSGYIHRQRTQNQSTAPTTKERLSQT